MEQYTSHPRSRAPSMTPTTANSPTQTPAPEKDPIEIVATSFLKGFAPERVVVIVAEAKRLRERLSSTAWYAEQERRTGARLWLNLAVSYRGEA